MKKEDIAKLRELVNDLRLDARMSHIAWLAPNDTPALMGCCPAYRGGNCECMADDHNRDVEESIQKLLAELDRLDEKAT